MIFPTLCRPPGQERQDGINWSHLRSLRTKTGRPDQRIEPARDECRDGAGGSRVEPLVNPAVQ
jgi:hypothetical protein